MDEFQRLQRSVRVYVVCVVVVGGAAVVHSILSLLANPVPPQWILLASLTILTGSFSVKVPALNAYLSVSEAFVFASVLLFGPAAGTVTVLLECLVILLWMHPQGRPPHRMLFNMAAPAVAVWASATAFYYFSHIQPYTHSTTPLATLITPLICFAILYFLLNSSLVAVAVGLEDNKSPLSIWSNNFAWLSVNYLSGASLAAVIVTYARDLQVSTLAIIVPLLLVSYLTFRTAMGRVEDSNNHLTVLNRLYFSTIETLAMAIDAKDQVTHGHIRRVQTYAIGLAREVGVSDETLLSAIEAAALLHDMGKLAIPEHILNKPGRLTAAEFEKMKLHASVGADILSSIEFPYPVVPIVRHHHENWDGTGYPSGLIGTDIPIGARILSVVDCFDALTSDRPYRPRLTETDAIKILIDRRGSMYDPLIVDTFIRILRNTSSAGTSVQPSTSIMAADVTRSTMRGSPLLGSTPPSRTEMQQWLSLLEICLGNQSRMSLTDTVRALALHLTPLVPHDLLVFYSYEEGADELEAGVSVGTIDLDPTGLRIPLGRRLSGWVAANRSSILNSDPLLDLVDLASDSSARLRHCLSVPVCAGPRLLGALSLYSASLEGFSEQHQKMVEMVSGGAAWIIGAAIDFRRATMDSVTGVLTDNHFQHVLSAFNSGGPDVQDLQHVLVSIEVHWLNRVTAQGGLGEHDRVIRQVSEQLMAVLRTTDLLFRVSDDSFRAILVPCDSLAAMSIVQRMSESMLIVPSVTDGGCSILVEQLSGDGECITPTCEIASALSGARKVGFPS